MKQIELIKKKINFISPDDFKLNFNKSKSEKYFAHN